MPLPGLHPDAERIISPREQCRLQSFPDYMRLWGAHAHQHARTRTHGPRAVPHAPGRTASRLLCPWPLASGPEGGRREAPLMGCTSTSTAALGCRCSSCRQHGAAVQAGGQRRARAASARYRAQHRGGAPLASRSTISCPLAEGPNEVFFCFFFCFFLHVVLRHGEITQRRVHSVFVISTASWVQTLGRQRLS